MGIKLSDFTLNQEIRVPTQLNKAFCMSKQKKREVERAHIGGVAADVTRKNLQQASLPQASHCTGADVPIEMKNRGTGTSDGCYLVWCVCVY
jgi:hypothetical protein